MYIKAVYQKQRGVVVDSSERERASFKKGKEVGHVLAIIQKQGFVSKGLEQRSADELIQPFPWQIPNIRTHTFITRLG